MSKMTIEMWKCDSCGKKFAPNGCGYMADCSVIIKSNHGGYSSYQDLELDQVCASCIEKIDKILLNY